MLLDAENSIGLLALNPDHRVIEGIHGYAVGLAYAKVLSSVLEQRVRGTGAAWRSLAESNRSLHRERVAS